MRLVPTVVLIHGGPGSFDHSYFKPDFARLAEHAQVVYLDLRGHGRSDWGDTPAWSFEKCADAVRARPVVFGHSMGGPIVLLYGARHPGHASGLIVQSGFAWWDMPRLVEGFRQAAGDRVAELEARSFGGRPSTAGSTPGVSAGRGLTVRVAQCGAGMAWSTGSNRSYDSCRSSEPRSP
jgi:pimeloyl-ACP methyl ester carboxylesterase